MDTQVKLFDLEGKVQPYQWGGFTYIPTLLSREIIPGQPSAEYWLGAHENAPAIVNGNQPLNALLQQHPEFLGASVQQQFGRLPYLLKVLDVKDMLSIQVHPSKDSALAGFNAENEAGIPLSASHRNYKDDNHKPELAMVLGNFWLLHGFRTPESLRAQLQANPELHFLLPVFGGGNYEALYKLVMEMEEAAVQTHLKPLLDRIVPQYQNGQLDKSNPDFWAARAALTYNTEEKIDKGIFSIYLLNLVEMKEGQAIFQDSGILHAYLEGQNVEIMANSDNVLRGGLTPKHIDVPELMKHVKFEPVIPQLLDGTPVQTYEKAFITPAADFELHQLMLPTEAHLELEASTVEIVLVLEGRLQLTDLEQETEHIVGKGQSVLMVAGARVQVKALEASQAYRVTVPQHSN